MPGNWTNIYLQKQSPWFHRGIVRKSHTFARRREHDVRKIKYV
jgi:hypothetical protein